VTAGTDLTQLPLHDIGVSSLKHQVGRQQVIGEKEVGDEPNQQARNVGFDLQIPTDRT
jgi:hypothetical protein